MICAKGPSEISAPDYRESHRDPDKPARYDPKFFEPGTTLNLFWGIERRILGEVVSQMRPAPVRALDFACGTGRILSRLGQLVPEVVGVDVSAPMLELARQRCPDATLLQADWTAQPATAEVFDLATAFRFLLNAQAELRCAALGALHARLRERGLLVANFHLNPRSLTGLYLSAMTRLRRRSRPIMMGLGEARRLLLANGFEPLAVHGYGYLLHRTHRVPLAPLVGAAERTFSAWNPLPALAQNFIVVARRIDRRVSDT